MGTETEVIRIYNADMPADSRQVDVMLADRLIALLAGSITLLPFSYFAGEGLATLMVRAGTKETLIGTGLMGSEFAMLNLIIAVPLATLALSGCRGCYQGRRSGFVRTAILAALSLPLILLLAPIQVAYLLISPEIFVLIGFVFVALIVAIYARLRLTTIGPTPI